MKTTLKVYDIWVEGDKITLRTDINSVDIVLSLEQATELINAVDNTLTEKYKFDKKTDYSNVKTFDSLIRTYFAELLLITGNNIRKAVRFADISMDTFKMLHRKFMKGSKKIK